MQPERLHEDAYHRIMRFRGTGDGRAVVTFEHGHDGMSGFDPPALPRFAQRSGIDVLAVQTMRRDWFISPGSAALEKALRHHTDAYDKVMVTGFSMGGYAALLYSAACHAARIMAVSPQYCIDPQIAPFDPDRHDKFARIGLPMPRPESRGNPALRGALIYDPTIRADRAHAALIGTGFAQLTPIALPHGGHPATGVIATAGGIGRIAEMVLQDRLDADEICQTHRTARRKAGTYQLNLARALLPRHPARAMRELLALNDRASPDTRFEACLLLLEAGHDQAAELLSQLLEERPAIPPQWARRLDRALRRSGI